MMLRSRAVLAFVAVLTAGSFLGVGPTSAAPPTVSSVSVRQTATYSNALLVTWSAGSGAVRFDAEVRVITSGVVLSALDLKFGWRRAQVSGTARQATILIGSPKWTDHTQQLARVRSCDASACSSWVYSPKYSAHKPPLAEQKEAVLILGEFGTLGTFRRLLNARPLVFPYSDWSNDVCSNSPDKPPVSVTERVSFADACKLHDYLYRNAKRLSGLGVAGVWTSETRQMFDNTLKFTIQESCTQAYLANQFGAIAYNTCLAYADIYYTVVRAAGGP